MAFLANALVIGKIISIASNIIHKEWKSTPSGKTAQKCPVCEGNGQWAYDAQTDPVTCHGCGGKGWVIV